MVSWQQNAVVRSWIWRSCRPTTIFLRLCVSPLTCRPSIGGITMTKLSGKKPQHPFSSPSHQPSSSVSFRWRLKSHIQTCQCPVGRQIAAQEVTQRSSKMWLPYYQSRKSFFFSSMIQYDLANCPMYVTKTRASPCTHDFLESDTTGLAGRTP